MAALTLQHAGLVAEPGRHLVHQLVTLDWCTDFYLAGSAALTLYVGHRPVKDLDLMSQVHRLRASERRDLLQDLIQIDPQVTVETARDGFLYVRLIGGTGVRLYYYPYPLIDPEQDLDGLAVASPIDLGLMKVAAIISRGTRRDFFDLFVLCRALPLDDLLARAEEKFGHVGDFQLQALKGLADLSLVEGEPMPELSLEVAWLDVETWLRQEVHKLGRKIVGLG